MFEFITDDEERGQVGIGTLIVFIAMVLVAAIAAGVLINTAGFLQTKSEQTGQQSSAQVTDRLEPVAKTGHVSDSGDIDKIDMVIQKSPGAGDINLERATLEFVGPAGVDRVELSASTSGIDFEALADDGDGSVTTGSYILSDKTDRVVLTLTVDQFTDSDDNAFTNLEEGDEATIRINTESGATSIIRVKVPQSLAGEEAVEL